MEQTYIYIYIYIERERERDIYIYIYVSIGGQITYCEIVQNPRMFCIPPCQQASTSEGFKPVFFSRSFQMHQLARKMNCYEKTIWAVLTVLSYSRNDLHSYNLSEHPEFIHHAVDAFLSFVCCKCNSRHLLKSLLRCTRVHACVCVRVRACALYV